MKDLDFIKNITPLARILRQEGFRFIIISQNHGDIARNATVFLKQQLPNRPICTIALHGKEYNTISAEIVATGNAYTSPIVVIPDFDLLFAPENAEINAAFNQRRDYYGSLNIAFVCFVYTNAAQTVRKRLPDWWSVRSYVMDITIAIPTPTENPRSLTPDIPVISKTKQQANEEKIGRLLYQITLATPENINLISNLYLQLGNLYQENYELEKAFAAYTFILDKPENNNNETLKAQLFNNIGMIYQSKGDYDTALNYHKKAVTIREKVLGTEHPDTAMSYNNIGGSYQNKGNYNTALNYYEKALTIQEKILGVEHFDTSVSYNNIGLLYADKGIYEIALNFLKKALDIRKKVLGTEHPSTATSYNNIAGVYDSMNNYKDALFFYQQALGIFIIAFGKEHPNTATAYNNIGSIYDSKGDYDTALDYYTKALNIHKKVLGTEHPDTANSYNNVAGIYENKGDYDTALNFYQKAVIIFKKVLTLQHNTTKGIFNNYKNALNKAKETLPNDIIAAHIAFIQAEFSEYL